MGKAFALKHIATQYHLHLGHKDKGRTIKEFDVCRSNIHAQGKIVSEYTKITPKLVNGCCQKYQPPAADPHYLCCHLSTAIKRLHRHIILLRQIMSIKLTFFITKQKGMTNK